MLYPALTPAQVATVRRLWAVVHGGTLLYWPSPKQAIFHRSRAKRRRLQAGTQTGKTFSAAREAWWHATGKHPYKPVKQGPTLGLVVSQSWKAYRDVVSKAMWEACPHAEVDWSQSSYTPTRGWKNQIIILLNGSIILFRSAESAALALAGLTVDWAWIDEPIAMTLFTEVLSRVAVREGPVWMSFTPIGMPLDRLRQHMEGDLERGIPPREHWEEHRIRLTPEDCPHRTRASIEAQTESYPVSELEQRVNGGWQGVAVDRVFTYYDDTKSVISQAPAAYWESYLGMDHGERAGNEAAVLVLLDPIRPLVVVLDDWISPTATDPEADAEAVRDLLGGHGFRPVDLTRAVGDTNSAGKLADGLSVNDLIGHELGISFDRPDKRPGSVGYGLKVINVALRRGLLKIHARARHTRKALCYWRGDLDVGDKELGHVVAALRYVLVPILEGILSKPDLDRLRMVRA